MSIVPHQLKDLGLGHRTQRGPHSIMLNKQAANMSPAVSRTWWRKTRPSSYKTARSWWLTVTHPIHFSVIFCTLAFPLRLVNDDPLVEGNEIRQGACRQPSQPHT